MKRTAALLLAMAMTLALAACKNEGDASQSSSAASESSQSSEFVEAIPYESEESVLSEIMKDYPEDMSFPMSGGDAENMVENAPGRVSLENPENLERVLSVPASAVDKIDSAASLVHMMNGNVFTAGSFRLKDASTAEAFINEVKENISSKQWLCGSPEKLLIASVGDYVVVCYGSTDITDTFKSQLEKNIKEAEIAVEQAIAQ